MAERIAVIGAPGTGKTRALKNLYNFLKEQNRVNWVKYKFIDDYNLRDVFARHYNEDEIVFITFTTAAAAEARSRGINNAYTMHSFITRVLYKKGELLGYTLDSRAFVRVMLEHGYGYDFRDAGSNHASNVALRKYTYYYNVYYEMSDDEILELIRKNENDAIADRIEAYVNYIRENNIIDYVQVLRLFVNSRIDSLTNAHELEKKVLMLDEAQDFSPLEWAVVDKMNEISDFDYIISAGDSNQSIYRFQGAVERLFEEYVDNADHVVVLKKSFRLPRRVYELAEDFVSLFGRKWAYESREEEGRAEVVYLPKNAFQKKMGGAVEEVKKILESVDDDDTVFVLTRTNEQAENVERLLIRDGYVTRRLKNASSLFDIFEAVALFEEQSKLTTTLLEQLYARDETFRELVKRTADEYDITRNALFDELVMFCNEAENKLVEFFTLDELLQYVAENYTYALKERDADFYIASRAAEKKREVFVDTMHASKGLEADVVIVLDYVSAKVEREIKNDEEALREEARLLYVAMTRAKRELYMFTSKSKRSIYRLVFSTLL